MTGKQESSCRKKNYRCRRGVGRRGEGGTGTGTGSGTHRRREKPKKGNRRKGLKTERRYAGHDKEAEKEKLQDCDKGRARRTEEQDR